MSDASEAAMASFASAGVMADAPISCTEIGRQLYALAGLDAVKADALLPGDALVGADQVAEGVAPRRDTYGPVKRGVTRGATLKDCLDEASASMRRKDGRPLGGWPICEHCQPFNIARAYDEAQGIDTPRIWTAARDRAMWSALQG